ncbi:MAG: hypothetical protein ACPHK8_00450 [Thermoplasmatota archaeon]
MNLGPAKGRIPASVCAGAGFASAFAVWAISSTFSNSAEPWDSHFWLYVLGLMVPAAVLGFFIPGQARYAYLGAWLGQVAALAFLPGVDRSWFALGVVSTALGSLLGLLGYVAGSALRRKKERESGPGPH